MKVNAFGERQVRADLRTDVGQVSQHRLGDQQPQQEQGHRPRGGSQQRTHADAQHGREHREQRDRSDQAPDLRIGQRQLRSDQGWRDQPRNQHRRDHHDCRIYAGKHRRDNGFRDKDQGPIRDGHERGADQSASVLVGHCQRRQDHQHRHTEDGNTHRSLLRGQAPCAIGGRCLHRGQPQAQHCGRDRRPHRRPGGRQLDALGVQHPYSVHSGHRPVLHGVVGEFHIRLFQRDLP